MNFTGVIDAGVDLTIQLGLELGCVDCVGKDFTLTASRTATKASFRQTKLLRCRFLAGDVIKQ